MSFQAGPAGAGSDAEGLLLPYSEGLPPVNTEGGNGSVLGVCAGWWAGRRAVAVGWVAAALWL